MFGWIATRGAALSASVLLHLLILFFGYYLQKDHPLSELIPVPKELPQKKDFEWAATEAAQSQFGAPVEFQSLPKTIEPKQEIQEEVIEETIEQLANGFLDHVKTNGTDTITTYGKKGIMPTDEQLKHQRYAEKIAWCLQQSFKHNHERLTDYHRCVVEVFLALNKNGTINQVSIAKPSGKPRVDQFVLYTFQDAQSSFPPVPNYFKEDPYKIVYIIQVDSMMRY